MKLTSLAGTFFIPNAGVILLWPFLAQLFHSLNLTKDQKFISKAKAMRAACLLEYLVSGQENSNENEIILNCALCNLKFPPTPHHVQLSSEEIKEAETLLMEAIKSWGVIRNTTIEGFRNTFLKRAGELKFENEKMTLIVERNTTDILLDKIPWGISIVTLPWMDKVLYVEW